MKKVIFILLFPLNFFCRFIKSTKLYIFLIFFSSISISNEYIYDMHFPQQDPPWYFWANSITDDKKGNICIGAGTELFFLSQQGQINKIIQIKDSEGRRQGIESISVDEEGYIYGLVLYYKDYNLVKATPEGRIIKSTGVSVIDAMYSNGYIYAIGHGYMEPAKIYVFDKDLKIVKSFGDPASSIWVDSEKIYAGYYYTSGKITIYTLDGEKLKEIDLGTRGGMGVCVDDNGYIYTKSSLYNPPFINKFDQNGNYIKGWGYYGSEPGNFWAAGNIHYYNGILYITDVFLRRIQIFNTEGNLLGIWTASGKEPGRFLSPRKIEVSNNEKIFVADTRNKRVQVFNKKGELEMIIGGEDKAYFAEPITLAVDDEGNIFVGDKEAGRIYKFDKKGNMITSWPTYIPNSYIIDQMQDIAVDKDGYVYVLDISNKSIAKFSGNGEFLKKIYYNIDCTVFSFDLDNQKNILMPCENRLTIIGQDGNNVKELIFPDGYYFTDLDISQDNKIFLKNISNEINIVVVDYDGNIITEFGDLNDLIKRLSPVSVSLAPDGSVYILEPYRVVRYKPKPGLAEVIPASASTVGANSTYWKTDFSIFNPSDEEISVDLNYFSSFGNKTVNLNLNPKGFLNLKDIISNYFNTPNSFGAMTSICLQDTQPIIFTRTYTEQQSSRAMLRGEAKANSSGTYGQGIRASPYEETFYQGEKAYLVGLKNNQNFRTNIGFFNLKEFPIEVKLKLLNSEGEEISSVKYNLDAFQHLQINNIFSSLNIEEEYDSAYAILWTDTQDGRFSCYSSIVDNSTGDPVYIEGEHYGSFLPEDFIKIIPVVASKEGSYGTNWKSEVILTNVGAETQEINLTYHSADGFEESLTITLEEGKTRYFKDILKEFFSFEETFGYLEIRHSTSGLIVRARVYTENESSRAEEQQFVGASAFPAQTYGQGIKALNKYDLTNGEGYLIDIEEDENFRTNLGILNLSDEKNKFNLYLIKDGEIIDEKEIEIEGKKLVQIDNVLSTIFNKTEDGFALKIKGEENKIYIAYNSKVDNQTGDGTFQNIFP